MSVADVNVLPDASALADAAAERFIRIAADAIRSRGRFVVALSGGSTPRAMYQRLGSAPMAARVDWSRVQVLWGDERCVPPDDAASNYRAARETMLDRVPIPAPNVHRILGEAVPDVAAVQYEATLRALLETPSGPPSAVPGARIDLVLLGVGADGHTASLFPGSAAVLEQVRWAMAERAPAPSTWRVTLTPATINAAAEVLFVVSGEGKAGMLRRVLEGPNEPWNLPVQVIAPTDGQARWYVDASAAAQLGSGSGKEYRQAKHSTTRRP